jgi:hypothetical protein
VGFEILQIKSPKEIVVWLGTDLTRQEFDALKLPLGWFKNQPREPDADSGRFFRSPNAGASGEFTDEEHFGHTWRHNATVLEANTRLDEEGLLRRTLVAKFHEATFLAGKSVYILISPDGEYYLRISRDADRSAERPRLPTGWRLASHVLKRDLVVRLPNPTVNIRADNQDSFQGPVPELERRVDAAF